MTTPLPARALQGPASATGPDPSGAGPVLSSPSASPLRRCFDITPERFAADHWNRTPLLVRAADRWVPGSSTDFDDLLSAADIDSLVGPRGLRTPFFTMVADGVGLPRAQFTKRGRAGNVDLSDLPDSDGIAAAHADGATLVLQAVHRVWPPLADFCRDLSVELGAQTQVNVYITPPGAQGFKPHHDTHDVLVLQVDGRKHWTIHPPAIQLPLKSQPSTSLGADPVGDRPPVIDTVLEPGDALYLPRGWLHSAQTTDERSIHLTVGLLATTWADVLTDLLGGAGHHDLTLRHVLALPGQEGVGADVDASGFRAAAHAWLEGLDDAAIASVVARRRRGAVPPEPVAPLAQDHAARTLAAASCVRPRVGLAPSLRVEGERALLRAGERTVDFPGWTANALHLALSAPTTASALAEADLGLDVDDAVVLLRRLVRERILLPC